MRKTLDDVIEELWNEGDWEVDKKQFQDICRFPFRKLAEMIYHGPFIDFRFIYFGVFTPLQFRIVRFIKTILKKLDRNDVVSVQRAVEECEKLISHIEDEETRTRYQGELRDLKERCPSEGTGIR